MKKISLYIAYIFLLFMGISVVTDKGAEQVFAEEYTSGDFTYTLSDNKATITGYSGSATDLTIPGTIDGKGVIAIGSDAFAGNNLIEKVVVPGNIETIGAGA